MSNLVFETSYRQLSPAEKSFVDDYVSALENAAVRSNTRLDAMLLQPLPGLTETAQNFLARPLVRAAISERVKELVEQFELSAHRVIKELSSMAFSSVADYFEVGQDGQPYFDLTKCTPEQMRAISSVEIEESPRGGRKFKFKLHDKNSALEKFMRYMGLLDADNPHWQELSARANKAKSLPVATNDDAAAAYSKLING